MTSPSLGSRRRRHHRARIAAGISSFAVSSIAATTSIGSVPRSRRASYSSCPATTTPITPPRNAAADRITAGTCHCPERPCTKVKKVAGTTVAPSRITAGTKLGFFVSTVVRRTSRYSITPTARTRTHAHLVHDRVMT
jgi:hypothetical protein